MQDLDKLAGAVRSAKMNLQAVTKERIKQLTEKAIQDIAQIVTIDEIRAVVSELVLDVVELTKQNERI